MPTLLTAGNSSTPGSIIASTTGPSSAIPNVTYSSLSSSMDSSTFANVSSQHHSYASTNKISNLVVDSTSHLPQIVNERSSPIIESTTTNSNNITQSLSPNDNVCELIINIFSFKIKFIDFFKGQSNSCSSHSPQSTSTITPNGSSSSTNSSNTTQKRLHVSNIPFRFRDDDLKAMFEVIILKKTN